MSDQIHKTYPPSLLSSSFCLRSPSLNSFHLQRIFNIFDKNGDAMITVKEISQALSLLGLDTERTELDSLVRTYIKPGNKGLTYEDLMALHESLRDAYFGFMDNKGNGDHEEEESNLSEAFKVFDEGEDGYISAKELQVVLRKLRLIEGNKIDRVQKMIFSIGRNHDVCVDFLEFKDMMRIVIVLVRSS